MLNEIWESKQYPNSWHYGLVACIFKGKGGKDDKTDPSAPGSYRPIMLTDTAYKIFMRMVASRLEKIAGHRLRYQQLGFQKHRSTIQALHILRRITDGFLACRNLDLNLLFLDWAKAFDRLAPDAIKDALTKHGIDGSLLQAILALREGTFCVMGNSRLPDGTKKRPQQRGIRQGCPASPYIFIIVLNWILGSCMEEFWEGLSPVRKAEIEK